MLTTVRLRRDSRVLGRRSTSSTATLSILVVAPSAYQPNGGLPDPRDAQRLGRVEHTRVLLQDNRLGGQRLDDRLDENLGDKTR